MPPREQIYRASPDVGRSTPLPMASDEAFGAGVGRGIAQLGGELHQAKVRAMALERQREEEAENARAAVDLARLAQDASVMVNAKREEALPDASGHVQMVSDELKARTDAYLEGIKNERVRQRWATRTAELQGRLIADEDGWARGRRLDDFKSNVTRAGDEWATLHQSNPNGDALEQSLEATDTLISSFGYGAAITEPLRRAERAKIVRYFYEGAAEKDPLAAAALLKEKYHTGDLEPEQLRSLTDKIDTELRIAAADVARQERAFRSQAKAAIDQLQKRFADHDPTISDEELEQAQQLATAAGLSGEVYDIAKARTLRAIDKRYEKAPSGEIGEDLRALNAKIAEAGEKASPDDVIARDHLQSLYDKRLKEEQADPVSVASRAGVAFSAVDWSDPASIRKRVGDSRTGEQMTGRFALLSRDEQAAWREELASGPQGKMAVIGRLAAIAQFDPDAAFRTAAAIDGDDRTLRHALRLPPALREIAVRGAAARETLPKRVLGPEGKAESLDSLTEAWFAEQVSPALVRSQPEFADDVLETARAFYADWRRRTGKAGQDEEFDAGQFGRAVNLALGGAGGRGGIGRWERGPKRSTGEPYPFILPSHMSGEEAERRFANPVIAAGTAKAPQGSVNGAPAWASGKPLSHSELLRKFVPVAVASGIYQFHSGGRIVMTVPEPGRPSRPYQVDIRRIDAAPERAAAPKRSGPRLAPVAAVPRLPRPNVRGPVWIGPGEGER